MNQYRIYRPNKNGNGVATAWQLSYKDKKKYDKWEFFLVSCQQVGVDDNGNAQFDWDNGIIVKLNENDLGAMLATLNDPDKECKLYHKTPGGGNKVVNIMLGNRGLGIKVSGQDADKNVTGPHMHGFSDAEVEVLKILFTKAIDRMLD